MKIIKLEMEFTESTSYGLRKASFDSFSLEDQVKTLDSENNRMKRKGKGYDKTYIYVTDEKGNRCKVRFDLGTEFGFMEKLNKIAIPEALPVTLMTEPEPFIYSVEYHYNTEGGMGCEVFGSDLKTLENAKVTLARALMDDPFYSDRAKKDWVIILTPRF